MAVKELDSLRAGFKQGRGISIFSQILMAGFFRGGPGGACGTGVLRVHHGRDGSDPALVPDGLGRLRLAVQWTRQFGAGIELALTRAERAIVQLQCRAAVGRDRRPQALGDDKSARLAAEWLRLPPVAIFAASAAAVVENRAGGEPVDGPRRSAACAGSAR